LQKAINKLLEIILRNEGTVSRKFFCKTMKRKDKSPIANCALATLNIPSGPKFSGACRQMSRGRIFTTAPRARAPFSRRRIHFFRIKIKLNEAAPRDERRMARVKNHRPPLREERILRMLRSFRCNRKSFRATVEFRGLLRDTDWLLVEADNSSLTDERLLPIHRRT